MISVITARLLVTGYALCDLVYDVIDFLVFRVCHGGSSITGFHTSQGLYSTDGRLPNKKIIVAFIGNASTAEL